MKHEENAWKTLFEKQHASLAMAADMLVDHDASSGVILNQALAVLAGSSFHVEFGYPAALRAVIKTAVAENRKSANSRTAGSPEESYRPKGNSLVGNLPWLERSVYYLREILRYSRRNTALLLSLSDANVEQLCSMAARRIATAREFTSPNLHHGSGPVAVGTITAPANPSAVMRE